MTQSGWDSERTERVGVPQGAPTWLPDDGDEPLTTNAAGTGKLATSGRDDVERGDTVSADASHGLGSTGRQSGQPTPGNRFAGAPEGDAAGDDEGPPAG